MKRLKALSFLLLFYLCCYAQSDSTRITTIASKLQKQTSTHPIEKVYLQFNKPGYNLGDTIWFKAYVTVGTHHQPSALSGVVYAELINDNGKSIKNLTLKSVNGVAEGAFALDKALPGSYHIRAYTNWMRNFSPEYFFNQTIVVSNAGGNAVAVNPTVTLTGEGNNLMANTTLAFTDKAGRPFTRREVSVEVRADTNLLFIGKTLTNDKGNVNFNFPAQTLPGQQVRLMSNLKVMNDVFVEKTTPLNVINENADIQFFPEGGQLINGVRSKVAFKAIGSNGLGIDIKGTVVDNEHNEVAQFGSQHAGMGIFAFTPRAGKTYSAIITLEKNLSKTIALPAAADKGFVLAVSANTNDSTKLNVRIATNEATLAEKKDQPFYITGQSAGVIYYTTAGKLDNAAFTAIVEKDRFPSGIAQFTLFSATGEPLNERTVFIQNKTDVLNVKERKNYGTENAPWMPTVTRSANLNGPGHANQIIDAAQLEICTELFDCMINKISAGIIRSKDKDRYIFARHAAQSMTQTPYIKFMLDGQFVSGEYLSNLNVGDVETIEVLNSSSYLSVYGTSASGGLIIITTKVGNIDPNINYNARTAPGVITATFKGYDKVPVFYVPKYTPKDAAIPDTRDAIYWNPNIITDEKGTFQIEYFNSDIKGSYRAVVEGIDNDGNIGRFVYRYKVE